MKKTNKSKIILLNTLLLYCRMIIIMLISLYTVRLLLNALGVEDYGIYNVVGGIVTMLSCVSGVLNSATQRFYSYSMASNKSKLQDIFNASMHLYIALSVIIIILAETIGLWFLNTQLVFPDSRLNAVNYIYQFSILSFIFTIISTPYSAAIIANEKMKDYAYISLLECGLKFIAAISILYCSGDKLILYGLFIFLAHFITFIVYSINCCNNYQECHFKRMNDKIIYKSILSFSGWSLFGSIARICMIQGNTFLVNMFFGPIVNAARAIALQISTALDVCCNSFITAVKPPLIKSYAEKDNSYLQNLYYFSSKFVFYSMLIICLPLYIETENILNLWLGRVDQNMVIFSKLIIIYSVILNLHNPITIIIQATGNIKQYFVPVELFTFLCLPLTFISYKLGYPAYSTFVIMIVMFIISHFIRLYILRKNISVFRITDYVKSIFMPALIICFISYILATGFKNMFDNEILKILSVIISSIISITILVYFIALNKREKQLIKNLLIKK